MLGFIRTTSDSGRVTYNKANSLKDLADAEDSIFAHSIEDLVLELEAENPAPAPDTTFINTWGDHTCIVEDVPIYNGTDPDRLLSLCQEHGKVRVNQNTHLFGTALDELNAPGTHAYYKQHYEGFRVLPDGIMKISSCHGETFTFDLDAYNAAILTHKKKQLDREKAKHNSDVTLEDLETTITGLQSTIHIPHMSWLRPWSGERTWSSFVTWLLTMHAVSLKCVGKRKTAKALKPLRDKWARKLDKNRKKFAKIWPLELECKCSYCVGEHKNTAVASKHKQVLESDAAERVAFIALLEG